MSEMTTKKVIMKSILFAAAIWISLTTFAIGGTQGQPPHLPPSGMKGMAAMECPMKVAGADLSIEDTVDGIQLTFTTKSGDSVELRRRVEAMTMMHGTSEAAKAREHMMAFSATYEAVPEGARITLIPRDPQKLEEFRRKVRQHADMMKKDECAMMKSTMRGMMEGMKRAPLSTSPEPKEKPEPDHGAHHLPAEK